MYSRSFKLLKLVNKHIVNTDLRYALIDKKHPDYQQAVAIIQQAEQDFKEGKLHHKPQTTNENNSHIT